MESGGFGRVKWFLFSCDGRGLCGMEVRVLQDGVGLGGTVLDGQGTGGAAGLCVGG